MSAFDVSVILRLVNNFTGPARSVAASMQHLNHNMHRTHLAVQRLRYGFLGLGHSITAIGSAMAGGAFVHGMGKIINKGNELVKIQRDMAQAGASNVQIQEAYAKAWKLTGKYQNIGAVDIMKMMNDARMIFGDFEHGIHNIEPFVNSASFLRAYEGHEKGGKHSEQLFREINAAMKSGEIAGKITPEEMSKHVRALTAMKVAFGEQLKVTEYLTAQRAAGVAMRSVDDSFRYGTFAALVQENGSNAGVMLMTAFNKLFAGVRNRTKSLEEMGKLGLLDPSKIEYTKSGHAKGLKDASAIKQNMLFAKRPDEWVWTVLKPLLAKKTVGLTGKDKALKEAEIISRILPDRNAAKAVTELLQQEVKLRKDSLALEKTRKALNEELYRQLSYDNAILAFHEQWNNLVQALGAPVIPAITKTIAALNNELAGIADWLGKNPETAGAITSGLAALSAALLALGTVLVGGLLASMIAGAGTFVLAFGGVAAAMAAGAVLIWKNRTKVKEFFSWIADGMPHLTRHIRGFANSMANSLMAGIRKLPEMAKHAPEIAAFAVKVGLVIGKVLLLVAWEFAKVLPIVIFTALAHLPGVILSLVKAIGETAAREIGQTVHNALQPFIDAIREKFQAIADWLQSSWLGGMLYGEERREVLKPKGDANTLPGVIERGLEKKMSAPPPNVSMPITINVGTANASPADIAGAVAGAGSSVTHQIKRAMSDGGQ